MYMLDHIYQLTYIFPMQLAPETLFRALADTTRLRTLVLLQREGELCVCELTHALDMIQPKISRHLALLREAGLVSDRRAGQWIYYRIHPGLPEWSRTILDSTVAAVSDDKTFKQDHKALCSMPNRPGTRCCA